MTAKIYYEADADLDIIRGRKIAILGYGNQGRAHALNLRDSGCDVRVGLRTTSLSRERAERDGFSVQTLADVSAWGDVISLLLADQYHKLVFEQAVRPRLEPGKLLVVAHGFSIHFDQLVPPEIVDVGMVAPVGPGSILRKLFVEGSGIPAAVAVHQDVSGHAEQVVLGYAGALGCTRAGVIRSTFQEETETDLFGEQVVLCGGIPMLMKAAYETLVGAGYQPEVAYFECVHQVKLIVDLIYEGGIAQMYAAISDTAEYGAYESGPFVIDEHVATHMHEVLSGIRDGSFARRWVKEYEAGAPTLTERRRLEQGADLEDVGRRLRAMMPWLRPR